MLIVRTLDFPGEADALRELRKRVLYVGLPETKAFYPGDENPETVHIGAFQDSRLVGIASLFPREDGTLQLRGMAILPLTQGSGVGAAIVTLAEDIATEQECPNIWCNARLRALGFYEKCGWIREGDEFDVPDIGPHYICRKPL